MAAGGADPAHARRAAPLRDKKSRFADRAHALSREAARVRPLD